MRHARFSRRSLVKGGAMLAASMTLPLGRVLAQAAAELPAIPIPPAITAAERLQRMAKARALMGKHGIGAIIVEAGPSLDHKSIWIRVRDDGGGIAPDLQDRVFEPWVTGKDAGTGLGLPIAKKLCEAHGGTLEVERTGPSGTSMLITLPDA